LNTSPDLSHRVRDVSIADVARALTARVPVGAERDEPFHEAAVALVLRQGGDGLEALFIKRATRAGDPWSGQIALPGGRRHDGEDSLQRTAMRETLEEIGLDLAAHGQLLGELSESRPRNPLLPPIIVRPYVFAVQAHPALVLNEEVAEAFWVPLGHVFDPARKRDITIHVSGVRLERSAIGFGEHDIWGMTEKILCTFEELWR
jgi:8-oxo-dGTP pyrophosphatase MutT (NUDIX family)